MNSGENEVATRIVQLMGEVQSLMSATREQAAATITAALIGTRGLMTSEAAVALYREVWDDLYPRGVTS